MESAPNKFIQLHDLGYTRLIPIIPPRAAISEGSSLYKRVGTRQDARGKTPGVRGKDGRWFSFDWVRYDNDDRDLLRWHEMGAGVGIKTGHGLIAIDADTMNEHFAKITKGLIDDQLGCLPLRIGRHPKALYALRVTEDIPYQRVEFGPRDSRGRAERIEILTGGRQFVAHGEHPATNRFYKWIRPLPSFDKLPAFTPTQISTLMDALRQALPDAGEIITEGGSTKVDQRALVGRLDHISRAVDALPNTSALFPSREHYRNVGYAIKAALPNHENEAFELFADWCARWTDGENDPDVVASDWRRMKPPYRRGAPWLFEVAAKHGQSFSIAEVWFENEQAKQQENPFAEVDLSNKAERLKLFKVLELDEIINRKPPKWLINRYIPKVGLGFLYSAPGAGKSFIALDMALAVASSKSDWHKDAIDTAPDAVVLYIAAEGSYGFRNRIRGWLKHNRLDTDDFAGRFKMIEQTINFLNVDDVDCLLETVRRGIGRRPSLIVVDTVSRAMPGADENLQKEMTLFVRACDKLREAFSCAILGVHHAGKNGDMRGSTVLLGAGDFVFRLTRKKSATIGTLACEKMKDGPDGWEEPYSFDQISLNDNETVAAEGELERHATSVVVTRCEIGIGPSTELTPELSRRVLDAMRQAWDAGAPWSKAPQAGERYAIRRLVADYGFTSERAEEVLALWDGTGLISYCTRDGKSKTKGYAVADDKKQILNCENMFD